MSHDDLFMGTLWLLPVNWWRVLPLNNPWIIGGMVMLPPMLGLVPYVSPLELTVFDKVPSQGKLAEPMRKWVTDHISKVQNIQHQRMRVHGIRLIRWYWISWSSIHAYTILTIPRSLIFSRFTTCSVSWIGMHGWSTNPDEIGLSQSNHATYTRLNSIPLFKLTSTICLWWVK